MIRQLIWDVPTRLIHWLLTAGLLAAFAIAKLGGEHSGWFDYHAIIGLTVLGVLVLRVVWGLAGSRHARFTSFQMSPTRLLAYFRGVISGTPVLYPGHNPATSWAAPVMFLLLVGIIATGVMMGTGSEAAEELHELCVYALLAVVAVHVAGVILHSVQSREMLVTAMLDGHKRAEPNAAIRSSRPIVGAVVLVLIGLLAWRLVVNYDRAAHHTHLPLLGTTITLGEGEDEGKPAAHGSRRSDHDEDDD